MLRLEKEIQGESGDDLATTLTEAKENTQAAHPRS